MTFKDIFKSSFLENFSSSAYYVSIHNIISALLFTLVLGVYIFFCYRLLTRRVFYSKNFNISLIAMALITAGIILTIQSSIVVSLGMVGALSIVRFRTAVKDPLDLVFLYWSISVGIMCGAGQKTLAIVLSLVTTVAILVFNQIPVASAPMLLIINAEASRELNEKISAIVKQYCKGFQEKTRSITNGQMDLVLELRVKDGVGLTEALSALEQIHSVSLMKHDGEVTF